MENKSSVKSIIRLGVIALLLSSTNAQQIPFDNSKDGAILENLSKVVAPFKEALDPYKTHEGDFERGVPKSHDKYGKSFYFFSVLILFFTVDCETMTEDP